MKKLTETSRSTAVTATAKRGEYEYNVSYNYADKTIVSLQCDVHRASGSEEEQSVYIGSMSIYAGNKSVNFPAEEDTAAHAALFEAFIDEIKEEIGA